MLINLGRIWVSADRVDGVLPPQMVAGDPELVTNAFFPVQILVRDVGSIAVAECNTYKEALDMAEKFAAQVNEYYAPSFGESDANRTG